MQNTCKCLVRLYSHTKITLFPVSYKTVEKSIPKETSIRDVFNLHLAIYKNGFGGDSCIQIDEQLLLYEPFCPDHNLLTEFQPQQSSMLWVSKCLRQPRKSYLVCTSPRTVRCSFKAGPRLFKNLRMLKAPTQ